MREYPTLKALREGETVELGGMKFRMAEGEIKPGDLYIAERNTAPKLLTAKEIVGDWLGAYIIPTTPEYPYNVSESVKVEEA